MEINRSVMASLNRTKQIILLFFFMVGIYQHGDCQDRSVKLYANSFILTDPIPRRFDDGRENFYFRGFSLAYKKNVEKTSERKGLKKISHEFETMFHPRSRDLPNDKFQSWYAHLRYERGKYWEPFSDKFFVKRGFGLMLYYSNENIEVAPFQPFKTILTKSGINLSYFFHLEYHITPSIYLDLNTSVVSTGFGVDFSDVQNPMLTERQQRQGGFDFDGSLFGFVRLGVGYIFKNKETETIGMVMR